MNSALRCDNSLEDTINLLRVPEFNYARFTLYLKIRHKVDRHERIKGLQTGENTTGLEYYTDEFLAEELHNMYGPLDETSKQYKKLFNNYKEERLEEIRDMVLEAAALDFPDECEEQNEWTDLSVLFTQEEIRQFSLIQNGVNSGMERFILPRSRFPTQDLPYLLKATQEKCLTNLVKFDPHLELPSDAVPKSTKDTTISGKLASGLQELISKHPFGISAIELNLSFQTEQRYTPDCRSLGYINFTDLVFHQSHIAWVQDSKNGKLVFPTYLEGQICTPMEIFWKICHQFKVILSLSFGIIKISEAIRYYENLYGYRLTENRVKLWGFCSIEQFIHLLFSHWSHSQIKCIKGEQIKLLSAGEQSDIEEDYLIHVKEEFKKLLVLNVKKEQRPKTKILKDVGIHGISISKQKPNKNPSPQTWAKVAQSRPNFGTSGKKQHGRVHLNTLEDFPPL